MFSASSAGTERVSWIFLQFLVTNVYVLHCELENQVLDHHKTSSGSLSSITKYMIAFCCSFCVCSPFSFVFWQKFNLMFRAIPPTEISECFHCWERQAHGGAYLITRVSLRLASWFMCPYVHTYREDLLMWFYVTYPAFFYVFFSTALCCVQFYCSTLDFLGLPPLEKSHLTLCSKTHICLSKCCTQVNIL